MLAALALSACAPSLTQPAIGPGGASLTLMTKADDKIIGLQAGTQDAQAATLTLTGVGLAVNDPGCEVQGAQLVCDMGLVPAGRMYVLPVRGVLLTEGTYKRADGKAYTPETDGSPE